MNMHPYSTNSTIHPKLNFFLVLSSIFLASCISWLVSWSNNKWGFAFGGISSLTIFGCLYLIFDKWIWDFRFLQKILLVPNLNGCWSVVGKTIKRDGIAVATDWEAEIKIIQSWCRISIILKTKQSDSRSLTASIYRYKGEGFRLVYHYSNNPKPNETELNRHDGECDLMFTEDLKSASGQYFTDRDRLTVGTMNLKRKDTKNE